MEQLNTLSFGTFAWRVTALHVISYFIVGLLALTIFDYGTLFQSGTLSKLMKPVTSPDVAAGPALQIIRGAVLALIFWQIRSVFLFKYRGWRTLWLVYFGLAVVCTTGPAPGSLEGFIYTLIPIQEQLVGLPEAILQTLSFSVGLYFWYQHPKQIWNILAIIAVVLVFLMSIAGVMVANVE